MYAYTHIDTHVKEKGHAQSCWTLWDPVDCSPPGSSVHGILQAKILEWSAMPYSRGSSRPRDVPLSLLYFKDRLYQRHLDNIFLLIFSQVVSDSLQTHGLHHDRPPCPSSSPRVCPSSSPLNQQCHPTISSPVTSVSLCPQSFPASGSFTSESVLHIR